MLVHRSPSISSSNVGAGSMDVGLARPSPPPVLLVTSPTLDLHFADDEEEVIDSAPPTPRFDGERERRNHTQVDGGVTQREDSRLSFETSSQPSVPSRDKLSEIPSSEGLKSSLMERPSNRTSESECRTQSDGVPDPSYAIPLDEDFMNLPTRSNGHSSSRQSDPHIAAILRDAQPPREATRSPVRSQSPTRPKLTHYASADEILQRFSEKWKKYQEITGEQGDSERAPTAASEEEMMPGRRRAPVTNYSKSQKRPSEIELLRQENGRLQKRLSESEEYYNDQVASLKATLQEGKKLWEKTNKENVELRSRAEVDSLKMERLEERIRMLENTQGHSEEHSHTSLSNEASLRRVVDMQEKELSVLRKEVELYQNRQKPSAYSSGAEQDGWRSAANIHIPREEHPVVSAPSPAAYTRMPTYTMGGIVCEDKLPKQYRSTGDLRGNPGGINTLPRPSNIGRDSPGIAVHSNTLPRNHGIGRERTSAQEHASPVNMPDKIYWVDDMPMDEPPRSVPQHTEPTFEPPKVHPMIVKMATKRKRQERSKTIGYGELNRSRSPDRAPHDYRGPNADDRVKPVWIQRVLNKRKTSGNNDNHAVMDSKPPSGQDRPLNRQDDQRRVNVYCLGRRVRQHSGGGGEAGPGRHSPDLEYRPPSREGRREKEEDRPPTSVLIESIRQRVREFNMSAGGGVEPHKDHGPADGRRSAEMERMRDESPQRIVRPASSMELGHHLGSRDYRNPLVDNPRMENEENEEDEALKHRIHNILDRRNIRNSEEQQPLRPPAHGPVRALHAWDNGGDEDDRWRDEKPQVPPLDLSKLKPEKIAQGTGLPTDMRNYADELIKKYMSSLAAGNPE